MKPKMKNVKITPLPMVKNKKTLYTKLCDSLLLLYIFTRIFGMLPLRLKKQNGVLKLEPQKSDKIYFGIYFVLYGSASIYTILAVSADNQYKIISKLLIFIMTNAMLAHMFLTIIFAFVMRKSFSEYLKKVSNVDEELYRIGISIDYKLIANVLWKLLGLMCASSTIRSLVMIQTVEIDIIEKITLFSAAFIKSLTKYAFMILSLVVCDRFKRINAKLDSIYKDKSIHDADIKNVLKNLRILSKLHYKLCNIVRILDKAFSLQLLLSLGISVADILFHSYYCYLALTLHYYSVNAVMIICPILWLIDEGLEVCLLVRSCSITCEQANRSPILLHEIGNATDNLDLENEIESYSVQMLHQKIKFSAFGFFDIDYTLLYSIVGSVATYLVIFIQFAQGNNNANNVIQYNSINNTF